MSNSTRIHFIRHGETDWNAEGRIQGQSESRLTELGRTQAQELRNNLLLNGFAAFYCSSSYRTRETMSVLLDGEVGDVQYTDDLREIFLGPWEGLLMEEIVSEYPIAFENFRKNPHKFELHGAEDFHGLQERGLTAVHRIAQEYAGGNILVVSHGAIIKSILSHFAGRSLSRLWDPPRMYNCAESIIDLNGNGSGRVLKFAGLETW